MTKPTLDKNGLALEKGTLTACTIDRESGLFFGTHQVQVIKGSGLPPDIYIDPPVIPDGKVAKYNKAEDGTESWLILDDFRGQTVYDEKTGYPLDVKEAGDLPLGYVLIAPPQLKAGEAICGFDAGSQKWIITPPTDLWKAQQNLGKYYQTWNQTYPVGNPPPDAVVKKAASLADWIKQAKEDDASTSQTREKSAFLRLNVEPVTADETTLPPCPPLLTDSDLDW